MKKIYKLSVLSALFLTGNLNAALEPRCASPILMFQEADQQDDVAERFFIPISFSKATSKTLEDFLAHTWAKPFLEGDRFSNGQTLLILAIKYNRPLVPLLLKRGANPNKPNGENDQSYPLFHAVRDGHPEIVEALLDHGASITAKILLHASLVGNQSKRNRIITLLLNKKPDLDKIYSRHGEAFLHRAVTLTDLPIIQAALALNPNLEVKNWEGKTPLHLAIKEYLNLLPSEITMANLTTQIIATLLQAKANVNAQDAQGMTALHHCASRHSQIYDDIVFPQILQLVKKLLAAGADWQMQDNTGSTFVELVHERSRPALLEAIEQEKERRAAQEQRNQRCTAFLRSKGSYLTQLYKLTL